MHLHASQQRGPHEVHGGRQVGLSFPGAAVDAGNDRAAMSAIGCARMGGTARSGAPACRAETWPAAILGCANDDGECIATRSGGRIQGHVGSAGGEESCEAATLGAHVEDDGFLEALVEDITGSVPGARLFSGGTVVWGRTARAQGTDGATSLTKLMEDNAHVLPNGMPGGVFNKAHSEAALAGARISKLSGGITRTR